MATCSGYLLGLRSLQFPHFTMQRSLAGRCVQSLRSTAADRRSSQWHAASVAGRAPAPWVPVASLHACRGSPAQLTAQPPLVPPLGLLGSGMQRQLHASTVCLGKKISAEGLVKRITRDDVEFSFVRSSGAGGQNVNKVSTKVDLRLKIDKAEWLPDDMKEALREKQKNRVNNEGELVVTSQATRTQGGNMEDALQKLQKLIDNAALAVQPIEEDPEKKKKLAKQKKKANENRLQNKKLKSMKKSDRRAGKRPDF